jgi:hypothetical protein
MFATIRRYESVDESRTSELIKKVDEGLAPKLSELPGFGGYYVIDAGDGVLSSISVFDNSEHAEASNRVASDWVREQKLDAALPKPPKTTSGKVVVDRTSEVVPA